MRLAADWFLCLCVGWHTASLANALFTPRRDGIANAAGDVVALHEPLPWNSLEESTIEAFPSAIGDTPFTRLHKEQNGSDPTVFAVIGVLTNVLESVATRQATRETWAARSDPIQAFGVRVVFLGCEPDLTTITDPVERNQLGDAIALEKLVNNDLLTSELLCQQSNTPLLCKKTLGVMDMMATSVLPVFPLARYVMITSDDIYVRVDRLVSLLQRSTTPKERYYAGFVVTGQAPIRDPADPNAISTHEYAMDELPSFTRGPQYILSTDLVRFLARNMADLQGLRHHESGSLALWLLTVQAFPVHTPELALLGPGEPCFGELISWADASPLRMRHLQEHAMENKSLCAVLTTATSAFPTMRGSQQSSSLMDDPAGRGIRNMGNAQKTIRPSGATFKWSAEHDYDTFAVRFNVTITIDTRDVVLTYYPSAVTHQDGFCTPAIALVYDQLGFVVGNDFCSHHLIAFRAFLAPPHLEALLRLTRHNLEVGVASLPNVSPASAMVVALSPSAKYSRALMECLLVEMYPTVPIVFVMEDQLRTMERPPDVFVFSIHDDGEPQALSLEKKTRARTGAVFVDTYGSTSQLVLLSGEAWPIHQLDPRVVYVSTVSTLHHAKQLYVPFASAVFAETTAHSPLELLQSYQVRRGDKRNTDNRRFCAYLYARCDRPLREYMFDLLNEAEPVDALGVCQGTKRPPLLRRLDRRYSATFYMDGAVDLYTNYKFVITFENTVSPGYVTEKIVTAFLAGSIPVFYGHSETVTALFNPRAFINCGDYKTMRACVDHVMVVHASPSQYEAMRREPPIVDTRAFEEVFSWHPDVVERMKKSTRHGTPPTHLRMADHFKRLLEKSTT